MKVKWMIFLTVALMAIGCGKDEGHGESPSEAPAAAEGQKPAAVAAPISAAANAAPAGSTKSVGDYVPPSTDTTGAKVQILEFSDFQCPFCSRVNPTIAKIKETYKGEVAIAFLHNALPFHKDARGAAIAAVALLGAHQMFDGGGGNLGSEVFHQFLEACSLFLPGNAEISDAYGVWRVHFPMAPDAGVLARVDRDPDAAAEINRFPAGYANHLLQGDTGLFHHANRFIAPDDLGPGSGCNSLRAVEMIEMRMPDDDPIALVHVPGLQARPGRSLHPINVGIQE